MAEKPIINCPNCMEEIVINLKEFVDVKEDPIYKDQIISGQFFMVKCPECGDEILLEYPIMYMDPDKKLNIYMDPNHDEELLIQLNSVEIPEGDIDDEAIFRVVGSATELLEKILIADKNRDDRIIELYKAVICENAREQWPGFDLSELLYVWEGEDEYFILCEHENEEGENLTVDFEEALYNQMKEDYLESLATEPNRYVEVNKGWLREYLGE